MAGQNRLDQTLVQRGLAGELEQAKRLVMAGRVRVDGTVAVKPGQTVAGSSVIEVEEPSRYVSRGGDKLAAALHHFPVEVEGSVCADVGASTGGFTDCLLQHGAQRVYAIDAGRGQLDWRLRKDERVVVMERTNARHLRELPEPVAIATADVSFISLKVLLPVIAGWLLEGGDAIVLVKPQFEAEPAEVEPGGVVRSLDVHRRIIEEIAERARASELAPNGLLPSPLLGPKGNKEYLLWTSKGGRGLATDVLLADMPEQRQS